MRYPLSIDTTPGYTTLNEWFEIVHFIIVCRGFIVVISNRFSHCSSSTTIYENDHETKCGIVSCKIDIYYATKIWHYVNETRNWKSQSQETCLTSSQPKKASDTIKNLQEVGKVKKFHKSFQFWINFPPSVLQRQAYCLNLKPFLEPFLKQSIMILQPPNYTTAAPITTKTKIFSAPSTTTSSTPQLRRQQGSSEVKFRLRLSPRLKMANWIQPETHLSLTTQGTQGYPTTHKPPTTAMELRTMDPIEESIFKKLLLSLLSNTAGSDPISKSDSITSSIASSSNYTHTPSLYAILALFSTIYLFNL